MVGVNFDGSQGQELLGEIEKLGIEFPSLVGDPRDVWGLEPVTILPETLIISPEGVIASVDRSSDTSLYRGAFRIETPDRVYE